MQRVEVTNVYLRCSSSNYYKRMEETVLERQRNTSKIEKYPRGGKSVKKKGSATIFHPNRKQSRDLFFRLKPKFKGK